MGSLPASMFNKEWADPMIQKANRYSNTSFDMFGRPVPNRGNPQAQTAAPSSALPKPRDTSMFSQPALPTPMPTSYTPTSDFAKETFGGIGANGELKFSNY